EIAQYGNGRAAASSAPYQLLDSLGPIGSKDSKMSNGLSQRPLLDDNSNGFPKSNNLTRQLLAIATTLIRAIVYCRPLRSLSTPSRPFSLPFADVVQPAVWPIKWPNW